ncbi:hypothetical protein CF319_g5952 [Tilletia indica]|nr:hypothetical protein CF319_g5952 [Tilletia indica]
MIPSSDFHSVHPVPYLLEQTEVFPTLAFGREMLDTISRCLRLSPEVPALAIGLLRRVVTTIGYEAIYTHNFVRIAVAALCIAAGELQTQPPVTSAIMADLLDRDPQEFELAETAIRSLLGDLNAPWMQDIRARIPDRA